MTKGRKALIAAGVLIAVVLIAGLSTLAAGTYGSKSDPLITKSYLDETVTPAMLDELKSMIDTKADAMQKEIDAKLAEIGGSSGSSAAGDAQTFVVVSIEKGKTLTCGVGTEIMPRIGTVVSAGKDAPRLIDETLGTDVTAAGTALTKNHMYMVTIKGNGITATANAKVLIRGTYTVS